jgi:hypothetical protein
MGAINGLSGFGARFFFGLSSLSPFFCFFARDFGFVPEVPPRVVRLEFSAISNSAANFASSSLSYTYSLLVFSCFMGFTFGFGGGVDLGFLCSDECIGGEDGGSFLLDTGEEGWMRSDFRRSWAGRRGGAAAFSSSEESASPRMAEKHSNIR